MKKLLITICLILSFIATIVFSQDKKVDFKLADMLEEVMSQNDAHININKLEFVSANINTINGKKVCDKSVEKVVKKLQLDFNKHPNIYQNIGPYLTTINKNGKIIKINNKTLLKLGFTPEKIRCNIFISVIKSE